MEDHWRAWSLMGLLLWMVAAHSSAQGAKELQVTAEEFSYHPATIDVPAGEVRIVVTNQGSFPHGFAIVDRKEGIDFLDAGETKRLTLRFDQPGEIVFYCPQPGHRDRGMEGKLVIGNP